MIGVIAKSGQETIVEEFFELFKTPWEFYRPDQTYDVLVATADEVPLASAKLVIVYGVSPKDIDGRLGVTAGKSHQGAILSGQDVSLPVYGEVLSFAAASQGTRCLTAGSDAVALKIASPDSAVVRVGYDLFAEVRYLLENGQPLEQAATPTLDVHIRLLREWILQARIPLLEITPTPANCSFIVCLTHDIDFVGIRNHFIDHSMLGFVLRATVGSVRNFLRRRLSFGHLLKCWWSVASLPFVYLGWAKDFWEPFTWYLDVESGLPATYYLIPFKGRAGDKVPGQHSSRRASPYGVSDLSQWTSALPKHGNEIGVHGIDAWHDVRRGIEEKAAVTQATGESKIGVRMHWLLQNANTPAVVEQAGYTYDSTCGYNDTIGYRAGTGQVFRPLGAKTLLELPMHIQDGALFYPQKLDLSHPEAAIRCQNLIANAGKFGGVLTVLWHDRSHGPERFWGDFYRELVQKLRAADVWFASGVQAVSWFQKRREVRFEGIGSNGGSRLRYTGEKIQPALNVRIHSGNGLRTGNEYVDFSWNGGPTSELEQKITTFLTPSLDLTTTSLS